MSIGTRVGILTFLHTLNYGALLQAYALQRVLHDNGFNAFQIDYRNSTVEAFEFKKARTVRAHVANIIRKPIIAGKSKGFASFQRDYIKATQSLSSRSGLASACHEFDYVIVGSDQVWNGLVTGFDTSYFLDIINAGDKKRTYAVSIGQDELPVDSNTDYSKLLEGFPCLLVREKTAALALRRYYPNRPIDVVLDPTLLADKSIWLDMVSDIPRLHEKPYVFVYAVAEAKNSVTYAKELAKEKGFDVVVLQQNGFFPISGVKNLFTISPIEFLSYIFHAEVVVTSSFHGLCLSLQMEREFFVSYAVGGAKRNSRMADLLEELRLSNRVLTGPHTHFQSIDWDAVRGRLEEMRKQSCTLLLESLKE